MPETIPLCPYPASCRTRRLLESRPSPWAASASLAALSRSGAGSYERKASSLAGLRQRSCASCCWCIGSACHVERLCLAPGALQALLDVPRLTSAELEASCSFGHATQAGRRAAKAAAKAAAASVNGSAPAAPCTSLPVSMLADMAASKTYWLEPVTLEVQPAGAQELSVVVSVGSGGGSGGSSEKVDSGRGLLADAATSAQSGSEVGAESKAVAAAPEVVVEPGALATVRHSAPHRSFMGTILPAQRSCACSAVLLSGLRKCGPSTLPAGARCPKPINPCLAV